MTTTVELQDGLTGRDLWRARVEASPGSPFLRSDEESWTYGEFAAAVLRLAGGLRELGVERATRVAVGLTNRPEAYLMQLALQELGAVAVPLIPGLTRAELEYPLAHSGATMLVVDGPVAHALLPVVGGRVQVVVCDGIEPPAGARAERFETLAAARPADSRPLEGYDATSPALVLYTSGSTGRPKGVVIGAGSLASVGAAFSDRYGLTGADNWLQATPVGHAIGAVTALGITVRNGGRLTLVDRFTPRTFWARVAASEATTTVLFPSHLTLLLETDDGSIARGSTTLRLVITHAYLGRFVERFGVPLATVWGMTETGAICTGSEPGYDGGLGENYVGTAMTGSEIGIFGEHFERLGPGETGEIALRHPHVMLGYLDDPDATANVLVDGWIRSGDRGTIDEHGGVFFAGRFKNMIKRSGENVSSEEVELALARHPAVAECIVIGVPDRIRTEEVAALVVVRQGATVEPEQLRAAGGETLARWKLPRYIAIDDVPFPRLANGKIDRVALTAAFELAAAWDAESGSTAA